jgi:hypothetical protein
MCYPLGRELMLGGCRQLSPALNGRQSRKSRRKVAGSSLLGVSSVDEAKFYRVVPAGNTTTAHNNEGEEDYKIHSK